MHTRWIYHIKARDLPLQDPYAPASLASQGFVHCSYRDAVEESARLYFPNDLELEVLQLDPRVIAHALVIAETPRGPMPHVHAAIPHRAIVKRFPLASFAGAPDAMCEPTSA